MGASGVAEGGAGMAEQREEDGGLAEGMGDDFLPKCTCKCIIFLNSLEGKGDITGEERIIPEGGIEEVEGIMEALTEAGEIDFSKESIKTVLHGSLKSRCSSILGPTSSE
mmetsp:Transcript_24320/g.36487  ORF Transcript_24320/g.36487 Transcript_24320/m.36487 type:complete len:110 (+) Transcript_24320:29-358(+)